MDSIKSIAMATAFLIVSTALGHGEDKPGPHGGWIRMPGAFHTEVVPTSAHQLKIYLLDINWKNPVTKNSKVDIIFENAQGQEATAQCEVKEEAFSCTFDSKINLNVKGKLKVNSTRDQQAGVTTEYETPLKHDAHKKPHH